MLLLLRPPSRPAAPSIRQPGQKQHGWLITIECNCSQYCHFMTSQYIPKKQINKKSINSYPYISCYNVMYCNIHIWFTVNRPATSTMMQVRKSLLTFSTTVIFKIFLNSTLFFMLFFKCRRQRQKKDCCRSHKLLHLW